MLQEGLGYQLWVNPPVLSSRPSHGQGRTCGEIMVEDRTWWRKLWLSAPVLHKMRYNVWKCIESHIKQHYKACTVADKGSTKIFPKMRQFLDNFFRKIFD